MPSLRKDRGDDRAAAAIVEAPTSQQQRPSCTTIADGHRRRRIVVVRPSITSSTKPNDEAINYDDSTSGAGRQEQHRQWPHYDRCCQRYGFSVDIEQIFMPYNNTSEVGVEGKEANGPRVHSFLVTPSNNEQEVMSARENLDVDRSPLRFMYERLVVRILLPTSSDTPIDNTSHHVMNVVKKNGNLVDGDVIMTLDGEANPTFAKLYELMCQDEKLVLEVMSTTDEKKSEIDNVNNIRFASGDGNVDDRDEVVGLLTTKKPNVMTNDRTTTTSTLTKKPIDTTLPILLSSVENTNNDEMTSNNYKSNTASNNDILAPIKSPMKPKLPEGAIECTYACLEIGEGWTQKLVTRKTGRGHHIDRYYFAPKVEGGRKFRSLVEVNRYLNDKKGMTTTNLEEITPPVETNDNNTAMASSSIQNDITYPTGTIEEDLDNAINLDDQINNDIQLVQQMNDFEEDQCLKPSELEEDTVKYKQRKDFFVRVDELKAYKKKHGHLIIRKKEDNSLYGFCDTLRLARRGINSGKYTKLILAEDHIAALDAIGFDWQLEAVCNQNVTFLSRVDELKTYKEKHGHLKLHKKKDGSLWIFCSKLRQARRDMISGKGTDTRLTDDRIASLDAIGFKWEMGDSTAASDEKFLCRIEELKAYKEKHGHVNVRQKENKSLYRYFAQKRQARRNMISGKVTLARLTEDQIASLDAIGFKWELEADTSSSTDDGAKMMDLSRSNNSSNDIKEVVTTNLDEIALPVTNDNNKMKRKKSRWGPKAFAVVPPCQQWKNSLVEESACGFNVEESCDQSIDDKYELELFNMVEIQLAEAQQQQRTLPSNNDNVSERERLYSTPEHNVVQQLDKLHCDAAVLEDEVNFVTIEVEQAEERLRFNEADSNCTIRLQDHLADLAQFDECMNLLANSEDGRTNILEDSCCSKSCAVTATTATSSSPPSLPSDDDVNVNSSSPAPEFFESAKGNDDASSTSASSSVASSSSDSSCSSTLSQVPIRRASQASKDSKAIVRPTTDIQTVSRSSSKFVKQPAKSLAVNHLPQKRPPSVISSSRARLTPATPIAPTSLSRLWPDPSDIVKALTRWTPPSARVRTNYKDTGINKQPEVEFYGPIRCMRGSDSNPLLQTRSAADKTIDGAPREFKDVNDMMETMAPLLLNEGMASLNGDYQQERRGIDRWHRDMYRLRLTKLTEVTPIFKSVSHFDLTGIKMYEAQFSSIGDTHIPPSNLSELYCMHFNGWADTKFGIVAHDFPTTFSCRTYNESNALLRLWLVVHENDKQTKNTGWLSKNDFKKLLDPHKNGLMIRDEIILTLMSCGSTTNVVRQFEAIQSLPFLSLHLQKAVFTSFTAKTSKSPTTTKPRSLPVDIWRHLTNSHNTLQLKSISNVLTGSCRENVCLIQGPPGTGKSSTIVGLISALLSGKAPRPKQRQSGCLVHAGKTMGVSNEEHQARNRILVCAATNVAVDSLAWKIKHGSVGPSGKIGDFSLARYGSLPWENSRDSIHQKPKAMSEMEAFLFEVNVDRRASDETQDFEYNDEERNGGQCWSPNKQQHDRKKRRRIISRASVKSQILGSCSVILTTLSGAGSKAFIDAVCRDPTRNDSEFDAVIIDEACQASEPESLIPFKFNPNTVTLVGDPKQLPVLTLSGSSSNNAFEQSLFERLQSLNHPTILLRTQYRMHSDIAAFPSDQFYAGKLKTPDSVKERPTPLWSCPCFPTICFWDINRRNMSSANGRGFSNVDEASFISQSLLSTFVQNFTNRSDIVTVGIISFYNDQVKLLKEQLSRVPDLDKLNIKVSTVDGFQGDECDIIILSCVRSHSSFTRGTHNKSRGGFGRSSVGFLEDCRRVNVALTRAKFSLWIVGNEEVLKTSELWYKLLREIYQRGMLRRADEFTDIFSRWKASNQLCL